MPTLQTVLSVETRFPNLIGFCPMVSWQSQTCPKEIAKVQKAKVRPAKTRQKNQDFRRNFTNNDWHTHKVKSQPIEFQPIGFLSSDPYRIQTCNLLIRSQTLYSIELRDHFFVLAVQSYCYFLNWQAFWATFFKKNY